MLGPSSVEFGFQILFRILGMMHYKIGLVFLLDTKLIV